MEFFKQHWGDLASLAGLIISVIVLLYAKRASEAAREAKEMILKRNVVDDLQEAVRRSQHLVDFLRVNEWKVARREADELQAQASWLVTRWGDKLDQSSKTRLNRAREQLRLVVENLDKMVENDIFERQKEKLLKVADKAREIFVEEYGKFLAKID